MKRMRDVAGKPTSNYQFVFGDPNIARLFSQAHGAMISLGMIIPKYIWNLVDDDLKVNLKTAEDYEHAIALLKDRPKLIATDAVKPKSGRQAAINADFVIIDKRVSKISIIEMKLGFQFDTGKRRRIQQVLEKFADHLSSNFNMKTEYYVCTFLEPDVEQTLPFWTPVFNENEIMAPQRFCEILGVNYDQVLAYFSENQRDNRAYLKSQLDIFMKGTSYA